MAMSAMPVGWHVEDGTLGTDVDTSSSLSVSGGLSVRLPSSSSVNAAVYSDWIAMPDSVDGKVATVYYSMSVTLRASSVAANKNVRVRYQLANQARSSIVVTSTIFNTTLTTANTWEVIGRTINPSTAKWVRIVIDRPNDINFDLYIDTLELKQEPCGGRLDTSVGASFAATWTAVNFGTGTVRGYAEADASADILYAHNPGRYLVEAYVRLAGSYSASDMFGMRIRTVDYAGSNVSVFYGQSMTIHGAYNAATNNLSMSMSRIIDLSPRRSRFSSTSAGVRLELIQYTGSLNTFAQASIGMARITDR